MRGQTIGWESPARMPLLFFPSVSSTGKPVYVFDLPGFSRKFNAFHAGLRSAAERRESPL